MPDFNLLIIKIKIFLKENLAVVLAVFGIFIVLAGAAVYLLYFKKPAVEIEEKAVKEKEEETQKIIESLTAPEEPKMTAEEKKELLKDLSAPKTDKKAAEMTEEEKKILESLNAK